MPFKRSEYPEVGDLVIATATKVFDHGAYVKLDEYGKEGYIPLGEVSSTWVRNIRDYVREGQKLVLKVIRVDARRGHIDLSLRRVTEREKKDKLMEWKRWQRAKKLLELVAKKLGVRSARQIEEIGVKLEEHFDEAYAAFEQAVLLGEEVLVKAGVPENWAKEIAKIAREHVELPEVAVRGYFTLSSTAPDGVERVKRVLLKALDAVKGLEVKAKIYTMGAPKYRVEIKARDYRIAEEALKRAVEAATLQAKEEKATIAFTRE